MKAIVTVLLFCIVLFFYLHIHFQLKVANDLEVFVLDNPTFSKIKLEELCDLRQPILIDFPEDIILQSCSQSALLAQHSNIEVNVRENKEETTEKKTVPSVLKTYKNENENIYLPLPLKHCIELLKKDEKSVFFTENNSSFLDESGITKKIQQNDKYIRPPMTSNAKYDILLGGNMSTTPLRYEISYRNYFVLTSGRVKIKLLPPKSSYYLHETKDYENFEFISPMNVWNIQSKYQTDFEKVKTVEVELSVPGKAIYIPAYWWYSIQFIEDASVLINCKYKTYMNVVAILPHIGLYFLQNQNIVSKPQEKNKSIVVDKSEENIEKIEQQKNDEKKEVA